MKFILITFIFLFTCCKKDQKILIEKANCDLSQVKVDTTIIRILPYKKGSHTWIFNNGKKACLSSNEIESIEDILMEGLTTKYNPIKLKILENVISSDSNINPNDFIFKLENYKRQYIAIINSKNEKEVWINCFCRTKDDNWNEQIVSWPKHGECYFRLKINLKKKKCYDFRSDAILFDTVEIKKT
jgi:hypothetical protein